MNAAIAAALATLADDYAVEAGMCADAPQRRLIRHGQTLLLAELDGLVSGRVEDDEAAAWLDAGRLTLARYRHGRVFMADVVQRVRTARL